MRRLHKIPILLGKETILFNDLKDWLLGKMQLFVSILILLLISQSSFAGTKHWNHPGGGVWTSNLSWVEGSAPGPLDDVVINVTASATITAVPSITLNSMSFGGTKNSTLESTAGATITINNTNSTIALNNAAGITLTWGNTSSNYVHLVLQTVTTATTISGPITFASYSNFTISALQTLTLTGAVLTISTNSTLDNFGNITVSSGSITINGTYIHDRDGGTIPTCLWGNSSQTTIQGITSTPCTGLNQIFRALTINCPGLTSPVTLTQTGDVTVNWNFIIQGSGTNTISLDPAGNNLSLAIAAGYTSSVNAYGSIVNSGTGLIKFTGALTIATNGSVSISGNGGITILNGINNNGTFNQTGTGNVTFSTNSQALSGTFTFGGNITVSGAAVNVTNN